MRDSRRARLALESGRKFGARVTSYRSNVNDVPYQLTSQHAANFSELSDYDNFYLQKPETNNFAISVLLSTKLLSFFMLFTSFAPSAYRRSHPQIEPKHGFDWGRVTGVMSNEIG